MERDKQWTDYCRVANEIAPLVFPRNLTRPSSLGEIGCHVDLTMAREWLAC